MVLLTWVVTRIDSDGNLASLYSIPYVGPRHMTDMQNPKVPEKRENQISIIQTMLILRKRVA